MTAPDYEVLVVGGGLVGAVLGIAFAEGGVDCAVLEARPAGRDEGSAAERPIALAEGTRRVLDTLGLWRHLADAASPIERVHVSDRGFPGIARMSAREMGVAALGQVVPARAIAEAAASRIEASPAPEWLSPAPVDRVDIGERSVSVHLDVDGAGAPLTARLLVVADGAQSPVGRILGIEQRETDYRQSAVSAVVTPTRDHDGTAYERFTAGGPLALLPLRGGRCGLVWTLAPDDAERLYRAPEARFLERLQVAFGTRLGGFTAVSERALHRLALVRASEPIRQRVVVAGNAANALHPVAGQGLNLAVRDAAALAETVAGAVRRGEDPGALAVLERYLAWRGPDQDAVVRTTDSLVRLFSNRTLPLVAGRSLGLAAFDLVPPVKRAFAHRAMGIAGRQSRLARGLSP